MVVKDGLSHVRECLLPWHCTVTARGGLAAARPGAITAPLISHSILQQGTTGK